jgi:hypothetical protein
VEDSCERGNESSNSIRCWEVLEQQQNSQIYGLRTENRGTETCCMQDIRSATTNAFEAHQG